jgi:hypothetical protein
MAPCSPLVVFFEICVNVGYKYVQEKNGIEALSRLSWLPLLPYTIHNNTNLINQNIV